MLGKILLYVFRNVSKSQARTYALVSVFVGLLIFWIGAGSGDIGAGLYIASMAWGVAAVYGLVWRLKAGRDRRPLRHAAVAQSQEQEPEQTEAPTQTANDLFVPPALD